MTDFIVTYKDNKYNVRDFLKSHPAGEDIILPFEDKDMTLAFDEIGHSKSAVKILNKYLIAGEKIIQTSESLSIQRKLFTSEDKFNFHKLMGAFTLCSFSYRYFYILPMTGELGFRGSALDIVTLLLHFGLSSSSLLFHILEHRIIERPLIIYEEYRLHAILFTTNGIVMSLFGLYYDQFSVNAQVTLLSIIFAIRGLIDLVTYTYGTKGVTAIRNGGEKTFRYIRLFYSFYQICALGSMIVPSNNLRNLGFNTLIAIQSSAFLMTLKRKSLIRYQTHVLWYSFSLILSYYVMYRSFGFIFFLKMALVFFMRAQFNMNKYVLWSMYVITEQLSIIASEFYPLDI